MTLAVGPFFLSVPNRTIHSGWSQQPCEQLIWNSLTSTSATSPISPWNLLRSKICSTSKTTISDIPIWLQLPSFSVYSASFPLLPNLSTFSHFSFSFHLSYMIYHVITLSVFFMTVLPTKLICAGVGLGWGEWAFPSTSSFPHPKWKEALTFWCQSWPREWVPP